MVAEMPMRWLVAAVFLAGWPTAQAGELGLGLGYDDVLGRNGTGAAALNLQLATDPLAHLGPVAVGVGLALEIDTDGDFWGGAGVTAMLPLPNAFRLGGSVMAGGYAVGDGDDLGSDLEFRSRLGISRAVRPPWWLGLAIEHKSNASIGDINPGVETLYLTLSRDF
jgi:hypothetical protein